MESIDSCVKKYSDFKGRAPLSEYWWFWGFYVFVLLVVPMVAFISSSASYLDTSPSISAIILVAVYFACVIGLFVPFIAVSVRRLHDTGLSGWHLCWYFLPYVGFIVVFVLMLRRSKI